MKHQWDKGTLRFEVSMVDGKPHLAGFGGVEPTADDLAEEVHRLAEEVKAHEVAGPAALRVGRVQGANEERSRLRPLLERCLEVIEKETAHLDPRLTGSIQKLCADLRQELAKP